MDSFTQHNYLEIHQDSVLKQCSLSPLGTLFALPCSLQKSAHIFSLSTPQSYLTRLSPERRYKALFSTREDHSPFPRRISTAATNHNTVTNFKYLLHQKAAKSDNAYRILNSFLYLKQAEKARREFCSHLSFGKTGSLPGGRENLCFAIHYLGSVTLLPPKDAEICSAGVVALYHLLSLPGKSCSEVNTVIQAPTQ